VHILQLTVETNLARTADESQNSTAIADKDQYK
jgi:hypothetical protein